MTSRNRRKSGRTKPPVSSSLPDRSPYFADDSITTTAAAAAAATKNGKNGKNDGIEGNDDYRELSEDEDDGNDEDEDDGNGNGNDCARAPSSNDWVATESVPAHLIGNPYFDRFHKEDGSSNRDGKKTITNHEEKGWAGGTTAKEVVVLRRARVPKDFSLSQAICSYGYFCLAPNRWVPASPFTNDSENENDSNALGHSKRDDEGYLVRPLTYKIAPFHDPNQTQSDANANTKAPKHQTITRTVLVAIGQDSTTTTSAAAAATNDDDNNNNYYNTNSVLVALQSSVEPEHHGQLTAQIDRMLRLDTSLEEFHGLHPEARERGFGRLYRSPTLFEDMVKTITNCNMKWGGTVEMNDKLCRMVGTDGAFPTPHELYGVGADFLKEHCRVGYRSNYIWNLAKEIVEGSLDPVRDLEGVSPSSSSPSSSDAPHRRSREDVQKRLLAIRGIGPFAANNILQLMGYFDTYPYDTETVRLWKEEFGAASKASKTEIFRAAREHYSRYESHAFTAYWFDLWKNYERRAKARSPLWSIEQLESERPCGVVSDHNCVFANLPPKPNQPTSPPPPPSLQFTKDATTKSKDASTRKRKNSERRSTRKKRCSV